MNQVNKKRKQENVISILNFFIENWKIYAYFSLGVFLITIAEHFISDFESIIPLIILSVWTGIMIGAAIERMED